MPGANRLTRGNLHKEDSIGCSSNVNVSIGKYVVPLSLQELEVSIEWSVPISGDNVNVSMGKSFSGKGGGRGTKEPQPTDDEVSYLYPPGSVCNKGVGLLVP